MILPLTLLMSGHEKWSQTQLRNSVFVIYHKVFLSYSRSHHTFPGHSANLHLMWLLILLKDITSPSGGLPVSFCAFTRKERGVTALESVAKNPCLSCHPASPRLVFPLNLQTPASWPSALPHGVWTLGSLPSLLSKVCHHSGWPQYSSPLFTYFPKVLLGVSEVA